MFFSPSKKSTSLLSPGVILLSTILFSGLPTIATPKPTQVSQAQQQWRRMTAAEREREIEQLINSPMGIAALNQLAIEGFIDFDCQKSFYHNEEFFGYTTLMRVQCDSLKGRSTAIGYSEARVIFNRFEGNIEDFEIRRISQETPPEINLPD